MIKTMESLPSLTEEVLSHITKEKADFVEAQTEKMYDFVLESRELLTKEAHTTLQWLFAIVIGASGYMVSLFAKSYGTAPLDLRQVWWALVPLGGTVAWAALESYRLVNGALRTRRLVPAGNTAYNLTKNGLAACDEHKLRFMTAWGMQRRIELVRDQNVATGEAINKARLRVVLIPFVGVLSLASLFLFDWLGFAWWHAILTLLGTMALARLVQAKLNPDRAVAQATASFDPIPDRRE